MTNDGHPLTVLSADEAARHVVLDLVSAGSDLTLVVTPERLVEAVVAAPQSGLSALVAGWEGKALHSLFAEESWAKLSARLDGPESFSAWIEANVARG